MKYDIESIQKRKNHSKNLKKILYVVLIIIIYNFVLSFLSSINKVENIQIFGYKAFIITTTSMEPAIKHGDVVITTLPAKEEIKEGDIITFSKNSEVITHRILRIENKNDEIRYVTKGDNNNIEDKAKIKYEEVLGRNVIVIPKLGAIIDFLENQIVLLVIALVVLILIFCKIQVEEKKDNRREKKNNGPRKRDNL